MVFMKTDRFPMAFTNDSLRPPATPAPRSLLAGRLLAALATVFLAASAQATVTSLSFQPTPADMYDLDHHRLYTWRIDNISLTGQAVTSATLSFTNIRNWDSNPNVLHLHLLDTALNPGVASFVDDPTGSIPVRDLTDDFVSTRYHNDSKWLLKAGTADTFLADPTFTTTGVNYTINFTASQLQTLSAYIANGNDLAFGLDPDCHFFNDGIKFTMSLTPVPEMGALCPIIGLLAAIAFTHILRRRRSAQLQAIEINDR
ncbi:hypothetical protein BH20VER3_BH20VER3_17720 [soil metagenome]